MLGVHVNALITLGAIDWQSENPTAGLSEDEVARVYAASAQWQQRSGYASIQSTRPQTLAYALTDSPLGLLAWDLEWFVDYDPLAHSRRLVDRDAILTNVTICWHTRTAGSSARLYKEASDAFAAGTPSGIPTAVAVFPATPRSAHWRSARTTSSSGPSTSAVATSPRCKPPTSSSTTSAPSPSSCDDARADRQRTSLAGRSLTGTAGDACPSGHQVDGDVSMGGTAVFIARRACSSA